MSKVPEENPHWDARSEGETVVRDLRRQIEAVKARMHEMRDGIAAAVNAPKDTNPSESAG